MSLFPHLVAGPIVRYGIIAEQMRHRVETVEGFALGLTRFGFGLSKKILLADPMGAIADGAFGAGDGSLTTVTAWIGVIAYAFQIYFDFSGYFGHPPVGAGAGPRASISSRTCSRLYKER